MRTSMRSSLNRRQFLALSGTALAAASIAPRAARAANTLEVLWWGESEANGVQAWVDDSVARFTGETGIPISSRLISDDEVASGFADVSASGGHVPDVQFLWNGTFLMQSVWAGFLLPLNEIVSRSILKRSGATIHSVFEGKQ